MQSQSLWLAWIFNLVIFIYMDGLTEGELVCVLLTEKYGDKNVIYKF